MASPDPLYKIVIRRIAEDASCHQTLYRSCSPDPQPGLTVEIQFDVCLELYKRVITLGCQNALNKLAKSLSTLHIFLDFLQLGHKRIDLHKMFELINGKIIASRTVPQDSDLGLHLTNNGPKQLSDKLSDAFIDNLLSSNTTNVTIGLNLASFLMDSGWYVEATKVLFALEDCFKESLSPVTLSDINSKLLHALSEYRQFDMAEQVMKKLSAFTGLQTVNSASELCEISNYFYWRSLFPDAHKYGMRAIKSVSAVTKSRVAIDVLRQAGK
jgi:hypothetical protein